MKQCLMRSVLLVLILNLGFYGHCKLYAGDSSIKPTAIVLDGQEVYSTTTGLKLKNSPSAVTEIVTTINSNATNAMLPTGEAAKVFIEMMKSEMIRQLVPVGTIIAFYPEEANDIHVAVRAIPTSEGWRFCDGSDGTPDLRGRMVLGAGRGSNLSQRTVGQTGGDLSVTLDAEDVPVHSHNVTTLSSRSFQSWDAETGFAGSEAGSPANMNPNSRITAYGTGGEEVSHNHMPPYYILLYIMKVE